MSHDPDQGGAMKPTDAKFDATAYPADSLFHDRRGGRNRRGPRLVQESVQAEGSARLIPERRQRKERRRRIDPTTFEKQYTEEEMEFMNAMQRYKVQSGISFPTHDEVLRIAFELGYRKMVKPEADASSHSTSVGRASDSSHPIDPGSAAAED
jgi:hypothetical protein